jgi:hypothetical protein
MLHKNGNLLLRLIILLLLFILLFKPPYLLLLFVLSLFLVLLFFLLLLVILGLAFIGLDTPLSLPSQVRSFRPQEDHRHQRGQITSGNYTRWGHPPNNTSMPSPTGTLYPKLGSPGSWKFIVYTRKHSTIMDWTSAAPAGLCSLRLPHFGALSSGFMLSGTATLACLHCFGHPSASTLSG